MGPLGRLRKPSESPGRTLLTVPSGLVRTVSENENPVDESNSAIIQTQPKPHPSTSLSNVQEDHQDENMKVSPNHIFAPTPITFKKSLIEFTRTTSCRKEYLFEF